MEDKVKEDLLLQNIFQICLKKEESNNTKIYLESYEKELKQNNEELYLQIDNIYFLLLHKIADLHKKKKNCLSYLCSCSARLLDKNFYKGTNLDSKQTDNLINEILDQIINSALIYLENLDIYPNVKISYKERINVFFEFLKGSCTSRFLKKMLSVIEENDRNEEESGKQLNKIFNPIINMILENLNSRNLVYPKNDIAVLLKFITSFKQIADLVMNNKSVFLYLNLTDRMQDSFFEKKSQNNSSIESSNNKNNNEINKVSYTSSPNSLISNANILNENEHNNNSTSDVSIRDNNISDVISTNVPNNTNSNNSNSLINKPCSKDKEVNNCGYNLQLNSLLGRLLSPTILTMPNIIKKEEIAMYKYFYNTTTNTLNKMTLSSLKNTYVLLRRDTDWILENCVDIIKNLLKGSNESKKKVLLWINCIILSNEKKTKIIYHYASYPQSLDNSYGLFLKLLGENSYGFCLNMFWVLLCLCEPITTNKINDIDFFFFLRNDPFSKFILKNITNQSSFEEKLNVEKIKNKVKNLEIFQKEPKFITCIFWMTFKSLSVFFKPAVDEFIKIIQEVGNAKDKNFYYMNIHAWKIFLYNSRFIQLLFKFLHLSMSYFLHVVYLYDINGNINVNMQNYLNEHKDNISHLVLKCCPPPNEKYYNKNINFDNLIINTDKKIDEDKNNLEKDKEYDTDELQREDIIEDTVNNNKNNEDNNEVSQSLSDTDKNDRLYASPQFSIIPTFFLSDIFEIIYLLYELDIFKSQNNENFLSYLNMDLFIAFSIFTMLSEHHIKSIHIRCESAPRTFSFLYKFDNLKKIIEESELTKKYIIKSLTNVFIASQKGEYTERMQTRVRIVENFNSFFLNNIYVNQFTQLVINNNNLFVHLIHLLLNDVSFLVEEVVSYLSEIKRREDKKKVEIENSISNANSYASATRNNRSTNSNMSNQINSSNIHLDNNSHLDNEESHNLNGSFSDNSEIEDSGVETDLTNESMRNLAAKTKMIITYCYKSCIFLNLLCKNYSKNIVTSNTILSQIVTCLNCYFDYLVGPKCLNIKVKNMEQYNFRPQLWLTSIVESYLFLLNSEKEHEELLIREIANEGRYYKPQIFNKAYYICKREGLLHKEELIKFKKFCQQIIDMKDEVELFDDVNDIPEKFLDPILQDIMLDPVLLPTSGIIIDRKNIERHLMSEPNDPFNRAPLSKEQLVAMPELKEEIHKYIDKLRQEKKEKKKNLEIDIENEEIEKDKKEEHLDKNKENDNEFINKNEEESEENKNNE
ncbi:ubiquitin conjugation factor E4 B, putative [Plasmodium gallinaceum]|uniref:RING-type E3 ubiquitin transferase n=1 Tax=Plasmodium gallinaceum TaxID=5849 RepID=A0A1J1GMD2_PLAGA|nr:ubiquitin conjugation factor E4 B, putative [Plasmodium gallinaceum]CRG93491.1 ubiquitin conjugation factor E4 B, putative [Plasmodium gallinaceum]